MSWNDLKRLFSEIYKSTSYLFKSLIAEGKKEFLNNYCAQSGLYNTFVTDDQYVSLLC